MHEAFSVSTSRKHDLHQHEPSWQPNLLRQRLLHTSQSQNRCRARPTSKVVIVASRFFGYSTVLSLFVVAFYDELNRCNITHITRRSYAIYRSPAPLAHLVRSYWCRLRRQNLHPRQMLLLSTVRIERMSFSKHVLSTGKVVPTNLACAASFGFLKPQNVLATAVKMKSNPDF